MRAVLPLALILLFLAQCGAPVQPPAASAPAAPALLSEDAARQRVIETVAMSSPGINAPEEPPQLRSLALATWREAQATYGDALPTITGADPERPVWVAELTGLWIGGMDAPGITTTPARYTSALVILDARTGHSLTTSYRP